EEIRQRSSLRTRWYSGFFFQAEDGIRDGHVTGVQTCALPISRQEEALSWRAPREGLFLACGPLLAPVAALGLLPLAAQGVRSLPRRALQVGAAVLLAALVAGLRHSPLPFTSAAPPKGLGIAGSEDPFAVAAALRRAFRARVEPGSMSVLRDIEHKIEGLFEGVFGRAFRTHVQPVELARKLVKEMEDHRVISVSRVYAPNEYTIYLAPSDREQFASYEDSLRSELQQYLAENARRERYELLSDPVVQFETDDDLEMGEFGIATRMVQGAAPQPGEPPSQPE